MTIRGDLHGRKGFPYALVVGPGDFLNIAEPSYAGYAVAGACVFEVRGSKGAVRAAACNVAPDGSCSAVSEAR